MFFRIAVIGLFLYYSEKFTNFSLDILTQYILINREFSDVSTAYRRSLSGNKNNHIK